MPIASETSLPTIIAHARAGSLDRAWAMFEAGGYGDSDDPAALTIKGRLLKDRAAQVSGAARAALYGEAADAYARAAWVDDATYPLINAATLSLLAGNPGRAGELAERVLARIAANPDEPETPYYQAATRAEALLLLGRTEDARAALDEAIALAPRAWEDHAVTLRQFALVMEAQRADAAWLDARRPPRTLHFGGHMSFRAEAGPTPLTARIADWLAAERIGFGYGALAAGADILIAEALVVRGAELHLVIPGGLAAFATRSVDPFGSAWRARFDALIEQAETVREVEPLGQPPHRATIALADEVAMGEARAQARRLASEAVQLLVLAEGEEALPSHSRDTWAKSGGTSAIFTAPRELDRAGDGASDLGSPSAVLAVRTEALAEFASERRADLEVSAVFTGEAFILLYRSMADAIAALRHLHEAPSQPAIGGYYGVADTVADPIDGAERVVGRALALALAASGSALPGTACVTDDFAAALLAADPASFRAEPVGELDDPRAGRPVGLFALRAL